jgi:hypothetical protein
MLILKRTFLFRPTPNLYLGWGWGGADVVSWGIICLPQSDGGWLKVKAVFEGDPLHKLLPGEHSK